MAAVSTPAKSPRAARRAISSGSAATAASSSGAQPCAKVRGSVLVSIWCRHGQPPKRDSCAEKLCSARLRASGAALSRVLATALWLKVASPRKRKRCAWGEQVGA